MALGDRSDCGRHEGEATCEAIHNEEETVIDDDPPQTPGGGDEVGSGADGLPVDGEKQCWSAQSGYVDAPLAYRCSADDPNNDPNEVTPIFPKWNKMHLPCNIADDCAPVPIRMP